VVADKLESYDFALPNIEIVEGFSRGENNVSKIN